MKKTIHIVPHFHWDKEWYFTVAESTILMLKDFDEVLTRLEQDDSYPYFVGDGQISIINDYIEAKPQDLERVKSLAEKGKLILGPWYTQTDAVGVKGESISRNLLYGLKDTAKYSDKHMNIGYLPDSFGMGEQLPQIFNNFGIEDFLFWRGASERHGTKNTEFVWHSPSGSKVTSIILPLGYAIGKYLQTDKQALKERVDGYIKVLESGNVTGALILPNGHDQMPLQKNIFDVKSLLEEIYPEYDFKMSKFEELFEIANSQADKLDNVKNCELQDGKYMRVHRTIYSTRMDIKLLHAKTENKVLNLSEPLSSLAYHLGAGYNEGFLELMWKEMLKNHAHDSIGCCCSDIVHKEIKNRFEDADNRADQNNLYAMRSIADAFENISNDQETLTLFNMLPYAVNKPVEATIRTKFKNFKLIDINGNSIDYDVLNSYEIDPGLIDRQIVHYGNYDPFIEYKIELYNYSIPAVGYNTLLVQENTDVKDHNIFVLKELSALENDSLKVTINKNGTINLLNKKSKKEFKEILFLENGVDNGDEYDYDPGFSDFVINTKSLTATSTIQQVSKNVQQAKINYVFSVPADVKSREEKKCNTNLDVELIIKLTNNSDLLDLKIKLNNTAKDQRTRLIIPTSLKTNFATSDAIYSSIDREVVDNACDVWEKENWKEKPVPIYPALSYLNIAQDEQNLAIINNGAREYEIVDDHGTIAITLVRSIGFLGKDSLKDRPGRPSGIRMPTPDSQMLQELELDFQLYSYKGEFNTSNVPNLAKEFLTPVTVYNKILHNAMKLNKPEYTTPLTYSLLSFDSKNVILESIKKKEYSQDLVVKVTNSTREDLSEITLHNNLNKVYTSNFKEDTLEVIDNNKVINVVKNHNSFKTKPFKPTEVKTFLLSK